MSGETLSFENRRKVLLAIDCIIKDVDKRYDECLVDHFLESLRNRMYYHDGPTTRVEAAKPIFDRLKSYLEHKAFVMLNQARAFKVFYSVLKPSGLSGIRQISSYLDSIWNTLDIIIVNENLAAMTVMMNIFHHLTTSKPGFKWLIEKRIEPPLKLQAKGKTSEIKDVTSLTKYYIETSNNYHTKNKAEQLFSNLVIYSIACDLSPTHPQILAIKQFIRDLMIEGSNSMVYILIFILKNLSSLGIDKCLLSSRYGIYGVIQESFKNLIDRPNVDLNNLCKCMALTNSSKSFSVIFEKLRSKNKLSGIIIYLSNSNYKGSEYDQLLLTYMIYPVLTRCTEDDAQVLIQEILATRDERDFIDKNINDRLVTTCIVQLNQVLSQKNGGNLFRDHIHLSQRTLALITQTMLSYIKSNYTSVRCYKNVMECCSAVGRIQTVLMVQYDEISVVFNLFGALHDIMETMQESSDHTKPILIELLKLLRTDCRYSRAMLFEFRDRVVSHFLKVVNLALKFKDHDIMNEFVLFFIQNQFDQRLKQNELNKYVGLVWDHMYMCAKETEHKELLGNLAKLLIDIDLDVEASVLENHNIRRNHDIPLCLSEILIERSADLLTVESIIEKLMPPKNAIAGDLAARTTIGYVSRLDSPTLPDTVKKGLDRLAFGLCVTIRGEAGAETRKDALILIDYFVNEIIINYLDNDYILTRLTQTGILETLYEVSTGSMYSELMYLLAEASVIRIKSNLVAKLAKPKEELVNKLIASHKHLEDVFGAEESLSKFQAIAEFYTMKQKSRPDYRLRMDSIDRDTNIVKLSTVVDDILNYELISDGISDCY